MPAPPQRISINIQESSNFSDNLLSNNPLVEFTLALYDDSDRMIYVNTFKGRLSDEAITSVLENIIVPEQIQNTFSFVRVYLDLVAYNSNRQKIQYAPIVDTKYSELVHIYKDILGQEYPFEFQVENQNGEIINLNITLIKESDMLSFCASQGYDLNNLNVGDNNEYINEYIGKILNSDAKIVISKLQSDRYKKDSARILKKTLEISKDEDDGEFIQSINNLRNDHLIEIANKYNILLKYSEPTGNDKIKAELVKTINESLFTYLKILDTEG
jgi:hypothetical protein